MDSGWGLSSAGVDSQRLSKSLLLALDRNQLHLKNQRSSGSDFAARAALAIGQFRRNKKLPLRSHGHELQSLRPSLDHPTHRKRRRPAVLRRSVKFLSINQRAFVIANYGISGRRFRTRS